MATTEALETSLRRRSPRRRRQRRALLLVGLGAAFVTAAVFFLGNSGTSGSTITAAPGTSNGSVAAVYTGSNLSGGTTTGHVTSGLPVAKVTVAKNYVKNADGHNVRITIAWTNATNSALNGKDVVGVGLYYPVTTQSSSGSCGSDLQIEDTNLTGDQYVCLQQDQSVTGKNVDTGSGDTYHGLVPLVASLQTGTLIPGTAPPTAANCSTSTSDWCILNTDLGYSSSNATAATTRTMYLVAQVLNPAGHAPPGQQPSSGDLTFFVQAKALG
ncbi:MAG TPA: hypothetical protein VJ986_14655 [Gaiellaceae bacterium]|nr:hypothetical protein [Gaiellaceae bacterium]